MPKKINKESKTDTEKVKKFFDVGDIVRTTGIPEKYDAFFPRGIVEWCDGLYCGIEGKQPYSCQWIELVEKGSNAKLKTDIEKVIDYMDNWRKDNHNKFSKGDYFREFLYKDLKKEFK